MPDGTTTTAAPAKVSRAEHFKMQLDKLGVQFQAVLPPHITVDRFKRVVLTAVSTNPELLDCDQRSLWNACMKAATDGLVPDGREAALVIFKGKQGPLAQYMPMVTGVLKRARNSGEIDYINAHVVYDGDTFDHWIDDKGEHFKHTPNWRGDRGEPIMVYAVARDKEGNAYVEPMSKVQIEKVRAVSRAKDNGPWVTWWEEMARKTALRRVLKKLPATGEAVETLDRDSWMYEAPQIAAPTVEATAETVQQPEPAKKGRRKKLDGFAGEPEPAPISEEPNGGPAGSGEAPAQEPPPAPPEAAPAKQPAAPTSSKPQSEKVPVAMRRFDAKLNDGAICAAMREAHADAKSAKEITQLWLNNQVVLGRVERDAPEQHTALIEHRDERLDALRG